VALRFPEDAEARRGFDPDGGTPEDRARLASLYFDDLLHAQVLAFNTKYEQAECTPVGELLSLDPANQSSARARRMKVRTNGQ
jgi:uncharacterized Zn finger protein